ncbi:MAG: DUF6305 family protein [Armatimonadota bacterium]|nr:DUF6305 family protein [Armatimonadota bacterium]
MRTCLAVWLAVALLVLPDAVWAAPSFTAEPPVLLTSAGQSADLQIVKVLLDRLKVPLITKALARPDDLRDAKTLVLAIGGSTKGLGAAGIDADGELARLQALLARAGEAGVKILALHVGGSARRGELSDRFIAAVVPKSGHVVVVAEGNADGLFTRLTAQSKVTMETVDRLGDLEGVLRRIFRVR